MDLDPMKRRVVTRILATMDTIIGLCVFILQIHRMWEYYYYEYFKRINTTNKNSTMITTTNNNNGDDKIEGGGEGNEKPLENSPFNEGPNDYTLVIFICISIIVLTTKVLQILMGFGLLVATFGRNLDASIRISTWWLRTSIFILITLIIKLFFMIFTFVHVITLLLGTGIFDYTITIFGIFFRCFSTYWVTRFIIFLQWQAEFESYCTHISCNY